MRLAPGPGGSKVIQITDDPPENNCRPAVDYLFRSVSLQFPGRAMGVILTGMGSDGTDGAGALRKAGAAVIAQDEPSSTIWGMPGSVVRARRASAVIALDEIGASIRCLVRGVPA